jgi:hypothetical protein
MKRSARFLKTIALHMAPTEPIQYDYTSSINRMLLRSKKTILNMDSI